MIANLDCNSVIHDWTMASAHHGLSWHLVSFFTFLECPYCYESRVIELTTPVKAVPRNSNIIFGLQFIFKVIWHAGTLVFALYLMIENACYIVTSHASILGILSIVRWRLKQSAAVCVFWIITQRKSRKTAGEACRELDQLLLQVAAISGQTTANKVDLKIRRFAAIFSLVSLVFLIGTYSETLTAFILRTSEPKPAHLWPFNITINYWVSEAFFLSTVDTFAFLPYCMMTWWCTLVYSGTLAVESLRKALNGPVNREQTNIESLQLLTSRVQSFYDAMESWWSGILFWHIVSCLLSTLSWLGDLLNEDRSNAKEHWFLDSVAPQMVAWNTVIQVGIPAYIAIQFQNEVGITVNEIYFRSCLLQFNFFDLRVFFTGIEIRWHCVHTLSVQTIERFG